jgi:hypothetical protein
VSRNNETRLYENQASVFCPVSVSKIKTGLLGFAGGELTKGAENLWGFIV